MDDELSLFMLNWYYLMVCADLYYKTKGFKFNNKTGEFEKGKVRLRLDLNKNKTFSLYKYTEDSTEGEIIPAPWAGMVTEIEPMFKELPNLSNLDGPSPSI